MEMITFDLKGRDNQNNQPKKNKPKEMKSFVDFWIGKDK